MKNSTYIEFCHQLKDLRQKHFSQKVAALKLGVSQGTISNHESCKTVFKVDLLAEFCSLLKFTVFLGMDGNLELRDDEIAIQLFLKDKKILEFPLTTKYMIIEEGKLYLLPIINIEGNFVFSKNNFQIFCKDIGILRERRRLSQEDVGSALRISQSDYSNYELGKAVFRVDMLSNLCRVLQFDCMITSSKVFRMKADIFSSEEENNEILEFNLNQNSFLIAEDKLCIVSTLS